MLFVLSATSIRMLKPLAIFAAVLFATTAFAGGLAAPAASAADPQLEAIIAGRLSIQARLQQCHIEIAATRRSEKNPEELNAVLAKGGSFTGTVPPARVQFLKDGDRWQHLFCLVGDGASLSDQLSKAAHAKQHESGKPQPDSSTTAPGRCNVYFSDGSGLYGTGSGTSVFNLQMDDGNIVNSAKYFGRPDVWSFRPFSDSDEQICHPLDPVLSALSAAVAKTRNDVTVEQITTNTGPMVKVTCTIPAYKQERQFLLDPSRSYASVSEHTKHPNGTVHYCKVIEWHDGKNFPKFIVAQIAMCDLETTKPGEEVYETYEYYVTRADLNKAPDFRQHPIEVAGGVQFNSTRVDPATQKPIYLGDTFRSTRKVTLDEWTELYQSLFANPGLGDVAPLKPPTKPGTSFAVWGLLAAGIGCIIAAIWTLRARSR